MLRTGALRVVLVEDHLALRKGIELVLRADDVQAVGVAEDAERAFEVILGHQPDVAVVDVELPGEDGIALTRRLLSANPNLAILLYTGAGDQAKLKEGLRSGARGLALKAGSPEELVEAIRTVAQGHAYVDPRVDPLLSAAADHPEAGEEEVPEVFDRIMALARTELGMDMAAVNEFGAEEVTYRFLEGEAESFGMALNGTAPLRGTYCHPMVSGHVPNAVEDVRAHPFASRLAITRDANVGAYLGVPITFSNRRLYGSLCLLKHGAQPRLTKRAVGLMRLLARYVAEELEFRELESSVRLSELELAHARRLRLNDVGRGIMSELSGSSSGGRLMDMPLFKVASILSGQEGPATRRDRFLAQYAAKGTNGRG